MEGAKWGLIAENSAISRRRKPEATATGESTLEKLRLLALRVYWRGEAAFGQIFTEQGAVGGSRKPLLNEPHPDKMTPCHNAIF